MNDTRTDILISRLIDGEAGAEDWQAFATHASTDPGLWRDLAEAQRQQNLLSTVVADATRAAASVELPDLTDDVALPSGAMHVRPRAVAWVGWAVAAALAIALWTGVRPSGSLTTTEHGPGNFTQNAALVNLDTLPPADLLQAYLNRGKDEGNVLGELPDKVLVETRPLPAGDGYDVLYIRTILERTQVSELYEFGARDEAGRPVLAKYAARPARPM